MENTIQVFEFEQNKVRVIEKDGQPWWVAKDVCDVLELTNSREALKALDEEETGSVRISDGTSPKGGNPNMSIINESGLYALIVRSNKQQAKKFRKWVTSDVLPSIRKHGAYLTPQKIEEFLFNPDTIIKIAQNFKAEQEKVKVLQLKVMEDHPKVLFADSVSASHSSILIGDLAKLIRQNGVDIGQNRLFSWLREKGFLIKRIGESFNMPTQKSMDMKLFEIKERTVNNADGSIRITKTPKVTGAGQIYFVNIFLSEKAA